MILKTIGSLWQICAIVCKKLVLGLIIYFGTYATAFLFWNLCDCFFILELMGPIINFGTYATVFPFWNL